MLENVHRHHTLVVRAASPSGAVRLTAKYGQFSAGQACTLLLCTVPELLDPLPVPSGFGKKSDVGHEVLFLLSELMNMLQTQKEFG